MVSQCSKFVWCNPTRGCLGCSPAGILCRLISNGLEIHCLQASRQSCGAAEAAATLVAPTPLLPFGDHLIPAFWHLDACVVCDGIFVCEGSLLSGACDGPISLIDKMGEASQVAMSPCSAFI